MFNSKDKTDRRYLILFSYALVVLISSFFFNSPGEIFLGMKKIVISPSLVLTDYMELINIGSALFNSGLMMMIVLLILRINKAEIVGPILAAFFTIAGFSLLGKNIYNFWSLFFGVYLYSRFQNDNFKKHLVVALFVSCLGPLVSQVSFGFNFPPFPH